MPLFSRRNFLRAVSDALISLEHADGLSCCISASAALFFCLFVFYLLPLHLKTSGVAGGGKWVRGRDRKVVGGRIERIKHKIHTHTHEKNTASQSQNQRDKEAESSGSNVVRTKCRQVRCS